MRTVKNIVIVSVLVFSAASANASNKVSCLQDNIEGNRVRLENINGRTKVTDIDSGEFIFVDGELAGKLTNEQYTNMLQRERTTKEMLQQESKRKSISF